MFTLPHFLDPSCHHRRRWGASSGNELSTRAENIDKVRADVLPNRGLLLCERAVSKSQLQCSTKHGRMHAPSGDVKYLVAARRCWKR